jgi:putative hydrolase of the HAD superfamily
VLKAVLFDLDDTLFPQAAWLNGAWAAVAATAARFGVEENLFRATLLAVAAPGSDRGRIIDRALALLGLENDVPVPPLVDAFHAHTPATLDPYPGVLDALAEAREIGGLAVVTDGYPPVQRAKLRSLGLEGAFDAIVISDEHGRVFRKPHPLPFLTAVTTLGVVAANAVVIGDRPGKDIAGAWAAGMRAIRVRQGEYAAEADEPPAWAATTDTPEAVGVALTRRLEPWLGSTLSSRAGVPGR